MKKILFIFILLPSLLLSQKRGVKPIARTDSTKIEQPGEDTEIIETGITRAVIIGVSEYQDPKIPDLRFSSKDAEAFTEFLKTQNNLNDGENLKILLNEKATYGQMVAALDWLMEETEEGDQAIIYFAGHGDVETKTRSQLGFLLTWDSPARSYMAGAYPVFYMQAVVQTLSLDNKAKVVLITDACRSGNLAGSLINGSQITNTNMSKPFSDEVKILSCRPEQYSLEGEQWGGGRGLFSYHLTKGLYGKADSDGDSIVNLSELSRYLEENVAAEAAPHEQIPMMIGESSINLSTAVPDALLKIEEEEGILSAVTSINFKKRGESEKEILASIGTETNEIYRLFNIAIEEKKYFKPAGACADFYYKKLEATPNFKRLLPTAKGNYAAALQDDAQQALNALLQSNPDEVNTFFYDTEKYTPYPRYLQRSLELLGEHHYTAPTILAKKYFFEAIVKHIVLLAKDKISIEERGSLHHESMNLINKAIELQPYGAYLYYAKGMFYSFFQPPAIDSVLKYHEKALEISPRWLLPRLTIASEYIYNLKDAVNMEKHLRIALEVNPDSYVVMERLNWFYQMNDRLEEADTLTQKMLDLRPDLCNSYGNRAGVFYLRKEYSEAEKFYKKSLELNDVPINFSNIYLGRLYFASRRPGMGIEHYQNVLKEEDAPYWLKGMFYAWYGKSLVNYTNDLTTYEPLLEEAYKRTGQPLEKSEILIIQAKAKIRLNQPEAAEKLLITARTVDTLTGPTILGYALTGELKNGEGKPDEAEFWFKKSISHTSGVYILDMDFREEALFRYGRFLINQKRYTEAEALFRECTEYTHDTSFFGSLGQALLAAKKGKKKKCLKHIEQSLERWLPYPEMLTEELLLNEVIRKKSFKKLIKEYFPEK